MLLTDIDRYITMGRNANICVYREKFSSLDIIILSISINHKGDHEYGLQFIFDPVGMIDCGEGWVWETSAMDLITLVSLVERYTKIKFDLLENVSRSNKLEDDVVELERDEISRQNKVFISKYKGGESLLPLLPLGVVWETRPYS